MIGAESKGAKAEAWVKVLNDVLTLDWVDKTITSEAEPWFRNGHTFTLACHGKDAPNYIFDSRDIVFVARVPELENYHSSGKSPEEAIENVREAIELWRAMARQEHE